MQGVDPTVPTTAGTTLYQEELSVDEMAQIQAAESMNGNGHAGNSAAGTTWYTAVRAAEPTVGSTVERAAAPSRQPVEFASIPEIPPTPIPPTILVKRAVSGRYLSSGGIQLELRIDMDRRRPMRIVSGDYYIASGATVNYFGSFIVNGPTIAVTPTMVTITGIGTYTWSAGAPKVRITIPRVTLFTPPGAATLQHLTLSDVPGATYVCNFVSPYFRTVEVEEDTEDTVTRFVSYDTGSLPSGGPARTLSVGAAYEEAGIQMGVAGIANVVPTADAGVNASWSNAELHASMERHFSLWRDTEQWRVWLFHALRHDLGPGLLGIMFDQQGLQRQGAAAFYQSLAGATPDRLRSQLYTCVHELGHCFNLFHSFHKEFMTPPQPNRPGALSWMNYPQRYNPGSGLPGGTNAFWSAFPFQFDDQELVHLRHAFRHNIIMGGNPFGVGAALEDPNGWANPVRDNSGFKLELSAAPSFAYGEPVSVRIQLSTTDARGKYAHAHLDPRFGFVELGIRKPDGTVVVYRPLIQQCIEDDVVVLEGDRTSISDSAFIGYGYHGFYFDQVGRYVIRTLYYAHDGSLVLSNPLTLRVRNPLNRADDEVAELFFGEEQGMLLYLLGGDHLSKGNDAFSTVLEQYGKHELAVYARTVLGINAAREFKIVEPDGRLNLRKAKPEEAGKLLAPVLPVATMREAAVADMGAIAEARTPGTAMALDAALAGQDHRQPVADFLRAQKEEIASELGQ